jgi:predicted secreted protein
MSEATSGIGTQFKIGDGATPETFTTVAEVKSIEGPELSLDLMDVTNMDSPSYYREVLPGFKNAGEVTLELNFLPAHSTHNAVTGLLSKFEGRTLRNYKIVFPNIGNTTWSFAGYVTKFSPTANFDEPLNAAVTITVTGAPTLA